MPSSRLPEPERLNPRPASPPPQVAVPRTPDLDDAYLLRLCLDLKLDALLLTLGAAATDPSFVWPLTSGPEPDPDAAPHTTPDTAARHAGPGVGPRDAVDGALGGRTAGAPEDRLIDLATSAATAEGAGVAVDVELAQVPATPWERWLREDVELVHALARELLSWGGGLPSSMGDAHSAPSTLAVLDRLDAFHTQVRALLAEVNALRGNGAQSSAPLELMSARSVQVQAMAKHCRRRHTELELLRMELGEVLVDGTGDPDYPPGEFLG